VKREENGDRETRPKQWRPDGADPSAAPSSVGAVRPPGEGDAEEGHRRSVPAGGGRSLAWYEAALDRKKSRGDGNRAAAVDGDRGENEMCVWESVNCKTCVLFVLVFVR
jgi:hypothetical protein